MKGETISTLMSLTAFVIVSFIMITVQVYIGLAAVQSPPLSDTAHQHIPLYFNHFPKSMCDWTLKLYVISTAILSLSYFHRPFLLIRRITWMITILYILRILSLSFTVFPSPDATCIPQSVASLSQFAYRVLMTMTGRESGCNDCMFSGHSACAVIGMMCWLEYCDNVYLKIYGFIHGVLVIAFALINRLHYTVDVVVEIIIASLVYHLYHNAIKLSAIPEERKRCTIRILIWLDGSPINNINESSTDNNPFNPAIP